MIDEQFVVASAAALGLPLSPPRIAGTLENQRRIEQVASALLEVELEAEAGLAPGWRP